MELFVKDRSFYGKMLGIALPIACQNLISFGVSMADTVMIGQLSEVHLTAAYFANQIGFVFMLFVFGLAGGCNVMISQFWGKRDVESIHKVITLMYRWMLGGAAVFTVIALVFPVQAMSLFIKDEDVIREGAKFLRIVGCSYLLAGFTSVTVTMLRSVGTVMVSVVMSLASLAVNVAGNWILIFGKFGAPRLEIQGAAIATVAARAVEVAVVAFYLARKERIIRYPFRHLFSRNLGLLREFFTTAFPVIVNEVLWSLGMTVLAVIIGMKGLEFAAANSVCAVLSQLVTIFIFGMGNAGAVIMGNTIGEGDYPRARRYAATIMVMSFLLGLFSSGVVLLLRAPMLYLYNLTDETRLYAWQIFNVYAVLVIFIALSANAMLGVLRGGGDTRFVLLLDIVFVWVICIPAGFLAVRPELGLPVWMVYAVIKCDEIFKVIFSLLRIKGGKWVNDVTARTA